MKKILRHCPVMDLILTATVLAVYVFGCTARDIPRFGVGGRYEEGRDQFLRGRGGDMNMAIEALEFVVSKDPTYKYSLMYLGRAYYRKGRFQDAYKFLQRALVVNQDDELAWLAFGATQLRIGEVDKGIETLKSGITLTSKVMVDGYHNYLYWDTRGLIRGSIRRTAFLLTKGAEEKDNIIQATDRLMVQIDEEDNFQKNTYNQNVAPLYQ
jgi:tetratricopeptide (TPR) repeat protein